MVDTDHIGGIFTVLEELKIGQVIISKQGIISSNYKKFEKIVNEKKIKIVVVEACNNLNNILKIENDLYINVLWPNGNLITDNVLNNNSIVCKLYYKDFSILFTGDIEEIAEKQILNEYRNNLNLLNSTVLKIGHHGSKTSSTVDFIKAVKPTIALIGVGENNKFGHPDNDVIERLEKNGVRIYRTDTMGEIILTVNNKGKFKVKKFIEKRR